MATALQDAMNMFINKTKNSAVEGVKNMGQRMGIPGIVTNKQQKETDDYQRAVEVRKIIESGGFPKQKQITDGYVYSGLLKGPTTTQSVNSQVSNKIRLNPTISKQAPEMDPKRAAKEDFGARKKIKIYDKPVESLKKLLIKQPETKSFNQATPTPPPKAQGVTLKPEHVKFLESVVFPITRQAGIPDAVVASQWAMEGGRVTSNPQNNPWGLMAGGKLLQYPSMEASTKDYAATVQNILKKKGYNVSDTDAFNILLALQQGESPRYEAHNPNPYTYVENLINTPEWKAYYQ